MKIYIEISVTLNVGTMNTTLVIHPHFRSYIFNPLVRENLQRLFSNILVSDRVPLRDANAMVVYNQSTILKKNLMLEHYHDGKVRANDKLLTDCAFTTYHVPKFGTKMYNIQDKAPRFLLWLNGDYEPNVCCTALYQCSSITQLPVGVSEAVRWARKYTGILDCAIRRLRVVVFDLDQTLIDNDPTDCKKLKNYETVLQTAREHYDFIVLWSHGSSLHVNTYATRLNFTFDLILHKNDYGEDSVNCKNLLHLYNYIGADCRIEYAILVDDSPYNWTPEYDSLIVPIRGIRDILPISHLLYKLKI